MQVLVVGHSGTRGFGLDPASSFVSNLERSLSDRFSDETVGVFFRGWGLLSQERMVKLRTEIEVRRPDYLILDPALTWVTVPLLEPAIRRRLPARFRPLLGKALRFSESMSASPPVAWHRRAYEGVEHLLRRAGTVAFEPESLYSIEHVVSFFEDLLSSAKRFETTGVIVLGLKPYSPDLWWARRTPHFSDRVVKFQTDLEALCARHHAVLFDHSSTFGATLGPDDLLQDQIHLTPEASQKYASAVSDTIARLEERWSLQ